MRSSLRVSTRVNPVQSLSAGRSRLLRLSHINGIVLAQLCQPPNRLNHLGVAPERFTFGVVINKGLLKSYIELQGDLIVNRRSFFVWVVLLCGFSMGVSAADKPEDKPVDKQDAQFAANTPHFTVQDVTDRLMSVMKNGQSYLEDNPQKYYGEVRAVLEPIVSFGFIAKNVMASYWKKSSEEQRKQFTETFTKSMVETLGKGMANYSDLKIETLPPEGDVSTRKRVEVIQEVHGAEGTNRVSYTMAQNKSGEWKLINVVLNGVNLGKSFRDQFVQAMRQNENNIDKVIANWSTKQG